MTLIVVCIIVFDTFKSALSRRFLCFILMYFVFRQFLNVVY